jgi:CheY-like chemotaxis protein
MDDDATVSEVVVGNLNQAGFDVDVASDGPTAVAQAAAQVPHLAVLDLMPPGMDGLEVCRRIRDNGPIPVTMLTARSDEEDRVLGLEAGADHYVTNQSLQPPRTRAQGGVGAAPHGSPSRPDRTGRIRAARRPPRPGPRHSPRHSPRHRAPPDCP